MWEPMTILRDSVDAGTQDIRQEREVVHATGLQWGIVKLRVDMVGSGE